jgi:Uma2 family endonuclease
LYTAAANGARLTTWAGQRTIERTEESMADLTLPRRATYADYCTFPDDGLRYEVLEGAIYMTPAPSTLHQFASKRLQRMLETALEADGTQLVFDAPIDVILSDADVVQPDLVVAARTQLSTRGVEGPPLLIVEILSPSRRDYDRLTKASRYAAFRIGHSWIVDPDARTLEGFALEGNAYQLQVAGGGRETLVLAAFDNLTLPLSDLWLDLV